MSNKKPIRVLVAEDDYLVEKAITHILKGIGYESIGSASNGKEAIEKTHSLRPDVILMDIRMPVIDGIEATRKIQETCPIPTVVLTAHLTDELVTKASEMGVSAYLLKPPDPDEIERAIIIAIARHGDLMEQRRLNNELKEEISLREKTEKKLQRLSKDREEIFQSLGNATIILDPKFNIMDVNRAIMAATGKSKNELLGRKCYEIMHDTKRPPEGCPVEQLITPGNYIPVESEMQVLGGTYIVFDTPVLNEAGYLEKIIHSITDITDRKQAEEKYINQLKNLINIGTNMRMELKLESLFQNICNLIVKSLGWQQVILSLRDYNKRTSRPVAMAGYDEKTVKDILSRPSVPIEELRKFLRDEFKISNSYYIDHTNWEKLKKYPAALVVIPVKDLKPGGWHEHDLLLIPIQGKKDILGFLSPDNPVDGKRPTEETVQALEIFADQAAVAIENARLYDELQSSEKIQFSLYKISEAANTSGNLEQLFEIIHKVVEELIPARNLYIALYDSVKNVINFPYFVDEKDEKPEPQKFGKKGVTEYVLRTGKPLLATLNDLNALEKKGEVKLVGAKPVDWLGTPLKIKGKAIGVIAIQSYDKKVRLIKKNKDILVFVSEQIAMAVERVRTSGEIKQSREQLRSLVARIQSMREEEKIRMTYGIREDTSQVLSALKIDLSWLDKKLSGKQKEEHEKIKSMKDLIDKTGMMIMKISEELRSSQLDFLGLDAAIKWNIEEYQKRTGIKCMFDYKIGEVELSKNISVALYRIFEELIKNIEKHAKAQNISISFVLNNGKLEMEVRDDGIGISNDKIEEEDSLGLIDIKERVRLFNGEVNVRSTKGKGMIVIVSIPIEEVNKIVKNG